MLTMKTSKHAALCPALAWATWAMVAATLPLSSFCFSGLPINGNLRYPFGLRLARTQSNNRPATRSPTLSSSELYMADGKVGIFFGTSTGSTQDVADLIAEEFGGDAEGPFDIESVAGKIGDSFGKYEALVVGTPTWNTGADTERSGTGWDEVYYGEMQDIQLDGKKVAVFGLGDQISYAENYADATGELHDVLQSLGGKMIGYTSQDGYEHEASKSIRGDLFCGLLCDAVNQEELTEGRVQNWVKQLISEGILEGGGGGGGGAPQETVSEASVSPPVAEVSPPVADAPVVAQTSDLAEAAFTSGGTDRESLERENARLRRLLEEKQALEGSLESVAASSGGGGFVPHTNKFGRTMWTSPDGRSCFFT